MDCNTAMYTAADSYITIKVNTSCSNIKVAGNTVYITYIKVVVTVLYLTIKLCIISLSII